MAATFSRRSRTENKLANVNKEDEIKYYIGREHKPFRMLGRAG